MLILEVVLALLNSTFPIYLKEKFGISSTAVGLFFGAATIANGISSAVSGLLTEKYKNTLIMLAGLLLTALAMPLVILAKTTGVLVIAMLLLSIFVPAVP